MSALLPSDFVPYFEAQKTPVTRHKSTSYDGVIAEGTDGINRRIDGWQLQFKGLDFVQGDRLDHFFKRRKGIEAIEWQPPDSDISFLWVVSQYEREMLGTDCHNFSTTFERVYFD